MSSCYDVLITGPETHTPKKRVCVLWTFTASLGNLFVRKCASAPANEFNALSKYYYLHRKEEFIVELEREREGESEVWFIMVASDSEGRFLPATRSDLSNRLENSRRTKWILNA